MRIAIISVSALVVGAASGIAALPGGAIVIAVTPKLPEVQTLRTTNSAGRTGVYYVPSVDAGAIPLLVFLHGTGGSGADGIRAFRALADRQGFAILAPDSGLGPDRRANWEVGSLPGEVTDDRKHVMNCLREMISREHLQLDSAHVLVAGHSGGGSSAPYLATNEDPFTAFAALHGGVIARGLGKKRVPGWFSTGSADPWRPPAMVSEAFDATKASGISAEMHVFAEGHEMSLDERASLIAWWLGT